MIFHKTPAQEDIIYRLRRMQGSGGPICRRSVMPQVAADVITTCFAATLTMKEKYATRP